MKQVLTDNLNNFIKIDQICLYEHIIICIGSNNKKVYKLHKINGSDDDQFAFISMQDSECWHSGCHSTVKKAIEVANSSMVLCFESLIEFCEWYKDYIDNLN